MQPTLARYPLAASASLRKMGFFQTRFGIQHPILLAPMAGTSNPQLAAAVTQAGGIGGISLGACADASAARASLIEIKRHADLYVCNVFTHAPPVVDQAVTDRWLESLRPTFESFGAQPPTSLRNIYPSYNDSDDILEVLLKQKPPIVSFHFGLPNGATIEKLHEQGAVLMVTATNLSEAKACEEAGIDVIIAQGSEAGGHRGCFDPANDERLATLPLVRMLKKRVKLPIVAAGGIMDGAGIRAALELGADAVQMGTAFILCAESSADEGHREAMRGAMQAYEEGKEARTTITTFISGRPARSLRNKFTDLEVQGAPSYPLTYDAGKLLHAAAKAQGEHGYGAHWAGQGVGMAREMPAGELMKVLVEEMQAGQ